MIVKRSSGLLDSRRYDDVFLLARILYLVDGQLTDEEKEKLKQRFEKVNIDE